MLIVPDASVILKWVINEPGADKALELQQAALAGTVHLYVPHLWLSEVGNTLSRRYPAHAPQLIEQLFSFGLREQSWTKQWLARCLKLAEQHRVTFYDAGYHSLAIDCGGTFLTADMEYFLLARSAGSIQKLEDWNM